MSQKILFGFHALTVRLKTAPQTILELHYDATRRDQRMRQFLSRAQEASVRLIDPPTPVLRAPLRPVPAARDTDVRVVQTEPVALPA